jgi:secreted trypsin-like serine protease
MNPGNVVGFFPNDIGLLELARPARGGRLLPLARPVRVGATALVQGWGTTCDTDVDAPACGGAIPQNLQQLAVRRLPGSDCAIPFPDGTASDFNDRTMLCMASADATPRSPCFGDSGSPVLRQLPSGRVAVTGVVGGDADDFELRPNVCTTAPDGSAGKMVDTNASAFLGFIITTIATHDRGAARTIQTDAVTTG